ncbi:unnamed protein product [Paramecium octaurelia]|uniref:Uncharacterized protein n=1 Tax=Paramecium octaurelia TaxID=43137 RepID=A0A8S1XX29_PAROT|nr:unnamed protein product [Paramecium octaurelia]CAD8205975.1 unnamed protein product [Paramecium octaurelia]
MKNYDKQSTEHYLAFLVVGNTSVGKTSLIVRYVYDIFEETDIHKKTLKCSSLLKNDTLKEIFIENQCIHLQIHDMSGPEKYIFIHRICRKAQGILILYDITNRDSFNSIQLWMTQIDRIANLGVVRILIGNKCDQNDNRAVTFEEGYLLAQQHGIKFFETSAKQSINIENSFLFVARVILEEQQQYRLNLQNNEKNQQLNIKQNKQSKNTKSCI